MNIFGFFPNLSLVEFCIKWIRIKRGPGVLFLQNVFEPIVDTKKWELLLSAAVNPIDKVSFWRNLWDTGYWISSGGLNSVPPRIHRKKSSHSRNLEFSERLVTINMSCSFHSERFSFFIPKLETSFSVCWLLLSNLIAHNLFVIRSKSRKAVPLTELISSSDF